MFTMISNDVAAAGTEAQARVDELETHIQGQLNGRVRGMRLLLHPNGLVLRGRAQSYHAKQLAQHLVMRGTSIPIVANEIEVP
jgi:hypothetical protein